MITYAMISKEGDRENNEDYIGMKEDQGMFCFVLADGLGGHGRGEAASKLVVEETKELFHHTGNISNIQWGHIGDSRLYHFRGNRLAERTLDHSVPQMLVSSGEIKEKEIRHHPDRNRVLRVMGTEWAQPKYEIGNAVRSKGSHSFLLCSDGFWELIEEKEMKNMLRKASSPEDWLNHMEQAVLENGKEEDMDNYSAIAVWIR